MNRRRTLIAPKAMSQEVDRPRARDLGVEVGIFPPGPWNAITDVDGVWVGQVSSVPSQARAPGQAGRHGTRPHRFLRRERKW